MPNPINDAVAGVRAALARHERRAKPSGLAFAIADRVDALNPAHWDALAANAGRNVLRKSDLDELAVPARALVGASLAWEPPFARGLSLGVTATNLLDERVVRTQNDVEILAYRIGVAVLASVEFSVE